jgi:hypothetical protein
MIGNQAQTQTLTGLANGPEGTSNAVRITSKFGNEANTIAGLLAKSKPILLICLDDSGLMVMKLLKVSSLATFAQRLKLICCSQR